MIITVVFAAVAVAVGVMLQTTPLLRYFSTVAFSKVAGRKATSKDTIERLLRMNVYTTSDFTIMVKNVPEDCTEAELSAHFAKVTGRQVAAVAIAYRNFDAWTGPGQMFFFVAGGILIIMVIWFWVLGQGAKYVTKLANEGSQEAHAHRRRTGSVAGARGKRGSAVNRGSITEAGTGENEV